MSTFFKVGPTTISFAPLHKFDCMNEKFVVFKQSQTLLNPEENKGLKQSKMIFKKTVSQTTFLYNIQGMILSPGK